MNQRNAFLRGAAVASALVLMGTFVAYRAGAFTKPAELLPQPPQPEQSTAPQQVPPELLASFSDEDLIFMAGSKSAPVGRPIKTVPPSAPTTPAPASSDNPTFMGGSKWIPIVPVMPNPNPPGPVVPPTEPPRPKP